MSALRLQYKLTCLWVLGLAACSGEFGPPIPDGAVANGGGAIRSEAGGTQDGGETHRAADGAVRPVRDENQPPALCGPDSGAEALPDNESNQDSGVDSHCSTGHNLPGCPCEEAGAEVSCWPGKRIHRNHGICQDGVTKCLDTVEFGLAWGPCEGYVLPDEAAETGPETCGCFASGQWKLSNVVPCIFSGPEGPYLYSSQPTPEGRFKCEPLSSSPPRAPSEIWSTSALKAECAGNFELCYTLKAGDGKDPDPDDCVLTKLCVDTWYEQAGEVQQLPDLPGWVTEDATCAQSFVDLGGYGEMSVQGLSLLCEAVGNGEGEPLVFFRSTYCPPSCRDTPDAEACRDCSASGEGEF